MISEKRGELLRRSTNYWYTKSEI